MNKTDTIMMYGTPQCDDCIRTKRFFAEHNVAYTFIDITHDDEAIAFVEKANKGAHITPTLVLPNGSIVSEPSNKELLQLLHIS